MLKNYRPISLCKHSREVFLGEVRNERLRGTRYWGKNSLAFVWTGELKMMFVVNELIERKKRGRGRLYFSFY